jgi:small-conductance mechanosensitive channel
LRSGYSWGEFVRIGDQEGRVRNLGLLATTIEKAGGTEVAIPNAVVTVNTITNFSRGGEGTSEVLVTSVTIGYDAPWRQVHGMLKLAAKRTPQLAPQPEPFVLQRALSDFYVEYQLHAHLAGPVERAAALSRLHAEIQDSFNEHGVQIMSPHFEGQPDHAVVVPRSAWFAEPADGKDSLGEKETSQTPAERSSRATS